MSLMDSLLLEPPKSEREVWIALRSDGVRGSGKQADPWNGSSKATPAVSISELRQSSGNPYLAIATANNHGFSAGEWITVGGVQQIKMVDGLLTTMVADRYYEGTFQISNVSANSFEYQMYDKPASAQAQGSPKCWRERERFDALMRTVPENTRIHLGPGVFETKGFAWSVRSSWQPKNGQKINGAGMGLTTLKLVNASHIEQKYYAIGTDGNVFTEDFEVSDLAVDCNIGGQPTQLLDGKPTALVAVAALYLTGRHARVRRIRAINFSSQTLSYQENFVIMMGGTGADLEEQGKEGVDCVIEDCIAEWPGANPVNNSTILMLGTGERDPDGVMSYHRGCAIRNCYVNGQVVYGPVVPIESINCDGSLVTITTKAPHQLTKPGNVLVRGVTVDGNPDNVFNGLFEIAAVDSPTIVKYRLTTSGTPDGSAATVGGGVSSHPVNIERIDPDETLDVCPFLALHSFEAYENRFKITTREPHFRTPNNFVKVAGVQKLKPGTSDDYILSTAFNGQLPLEADKYGAFPVDPDRHEPDKPRELYYTLREQADAPTKDLKFDTAFINVGHTALSADNGTAAIVEGNRVYHCAGGGPYHDTWPTKDLIVRFNYYHDVLWGPFQAFGGISSTSMPVPVALSHDGTTATASVFFRNSAFHPDPNLPFPHGFRVNDAVTISGDINPAYKGTFRITEVPGINQFKYENIAPAGTIYGAGYSTYEEIVVVPYQFTVTSQRRLYSLERIQQGTSPNSRYFGRAKIFQEASFYKHGLSVGDWVRITKAGHFINGTFESGSKFNGNVRITAVPDPQTFEYEIRDQNGNPVDPGAGSPDSTFCAGYYGRIWQMRDLVIEDNVIELGIRQLTGVQEAWGHGSGIAMYGARLFPPSYPLVQVIIRRNVIRNVNEGSSPSTRAIEVSGCQQALIENNLISIDRATPIEHNRIGLVQTFNNLKPDGALIQSSATDGQIPAREVITEIQADFEEAMLSSFLEL